MKWGSLLLAVLLWPAGLAAEPAENDRIWEKNRDAQRRLPEKTRELTDQQNANARDKASIRNLKNSVSQLENVLGNLRNPSAARPWQVPQITYTVSEVLLDIPFSDQDQLPKGMRLPAWATIAPAPDGRPALKIEVDTATQQSTKGLNNLVFHLPAQAVAGRRLACRALVSATDVESSKTATSGGKFVLHYVAGDKSQWPGTKLGYGSFDWKEVRLDAAIPNGPSGVFLAIGLQGVTGTIYFRDLKVETLSEQ